MDPKSWFYWKKEFDSNFSIFKPYFRICIESPLTKFQLLNNEYRYWSQIFRKCVKLIFFLLKDYLRYKTITSQHVSSKAQVKSFLILQQRYAPFSRYSSFCIFNHFIIYQICNIMVSISACDTCIFEYVCWTTTR